MAQRTAPVRTSRVQSQQSRNTRRARASSRTDRNDIGRRLTGYVLRFAVNRVVEQRRHRNNEPGHSSGGGHEGSALGHAVTNALLEELIQEVIEFIVRHNFFMGKNNNENDEGEERRGSAGQQNPAGAGGTATQRAGDSQREELPPSASQHSSQSPTDERRRRRHRRRSETMMHSLDRLSNELEATYDATVRVLREPSDEAASMMSVNKIDAGNKDEDSQIQEPINHNAKEIDESLRTNLENLRRATTRCMVRVESVRRSHYHGSSSSSRRGSRHRRAERRLHLSRSGSAMTDR